MYMAVGWPAGSGGIAASKWKEVVRPLMLEISFYRINHHGARTQRSEGDCRKLNLHGCRAAWLVHGRRSMPSFQKKERHVQQAWQ